jgi:hypothetical protein
MIGSGRLDKRDRSRQSGTVTCANRFGKNAGVAVGRHQPSS